jgi:hypothetical protein
LPVSSAARPRYRTPPEGRSPPRSPRAPSPRRQRDGAPGDGQLQDHRASTRRHDVR